MRPSSRAILRADQPWADSAALREIRLRGISRDVASTAGVVVVERLPAYAPELNPVEYMWGHLKTHEIGNLVAHSAWELSMEATAALRRMRRRPTLLTACYSQAELRP